MQHQKWSSISGITREITNFKKKEDEINVGNWEKGKQKIKHFSKTTRVDDADPSVESEQVEPEQYK